MIRLFHIGLTMLLFAAPGLELWAQIHPAPNLLDDQFIRNAAGIRPYRAGQIRLEESRLASGKPIFHNYGHGGGGISLAWGSAKHVVDLFLKTTEAQGLRRSKTPVAILGSGIMGLCTAYLLMEAGFQVRIYTGARTPKTTSDVAGGLWMPVSVATGETEKEKKLFEKISIDSYRMFFDIDDFEDLVKELPLYVPRSSDGTEDYVDVTRQAFAPLIRAGYVEPISELANLPIENLSVPGIVVHTLMIDTPQYMKRLEIEVAQKGAQFKRQQFTKLSEVEALQEAVIFNTLGMGSASVFGDEKMQPIRGQLVLMNPDPRIQYMVIHPKAYLFPRSDALVIGGTFEKGAAEAVADPAACKQILMNARSLFSGN